MVHNKVSEVYQTTNYEQFKKLPGNRELKEENVLKKMKSIKQFGQLAPIIISLLGFVIEGQHRLEACRRLGIPVTYIIDGDAGLKEAIECNANQKNWGPYDFAFANAQKGIKDYSILLEFQAKYNLSISVALELLSASVRKDKGGETNIASFRDGKFKVINYEMADVIAKDVLWYLKYFKKSKNLRFVRALSTCYYTPKFSPIRMREKMSGISVEANRKLMGCITFNDYISILEYIYNYNARRGDILHFRAQ